MQIAPALVFGVHRAPFELEEAGTQWLSVDGYVTVRERDSRSIGRHERVHLRVRRPLKPAHVPLDAPSDFAVRWNGVNADADGAPVPDGDLHRHLRATRHPACIEESPRVHGTGQLGIREIGHALRTGREVLVVAGDGGFITRSAGTTWPGMGGDPDACLTGLARCLFATGRALLRTATISDALGRRIIRFLFAGGLVFPPSGVSRVPDADGDARCAYEEDEEANRPVPFGPSKVITSELAGEVI
jgi:hypothetical protein